MKKRKIYNILISFFNAVSDFKDSKKNGKYHILKNGVDIEVIKISIGLSIKEIEKLKSVE